MHSTQTIFGANIKLKISWMGNSLLVAVFVHAPWFMFLRVASITAFWSHSMSMTDVKKKKKPQTHLVNVQLSRPGGLNVTPRLCSQVHHHRTILHGLHKFFLDQNGSPLSWTKDKNHKTIKSCTADQSMDYCNFWLANQDGWTTKYSARVRVTDLESGRYW